MTRPASKSVGSTAVLQALGMSLVLCALAWALWGLKDPIVMLKWRQPLIGLLVLQAVPCLLLLGRSRWRALVVLSRFGLLLVLGFPLGEDFVIESLVLCSIILDIVILYPTAASVAISAIAVSVTLATQQPFSLGVFRRKPPLPCLCSSAPRPLPPRWSFLSVCAARTSALRSRTPSLPN